MSANNYSVHSCVTDAGYRGRNNGIPDDDDHDLPLTESKRADSRLPIRRHAKAVAQTLSQIRPC
jgi:hypothetical protein